MVQGAREAQEERQEALVRAATEQQVVLPERLALSTLEDSSVLTTVLS